MYHNYHAVEKGFCYPEVIFLFVLMYIVQYPKLPLCKLTDFLFFAAGWWVHSVPIRKCHHKAFRLQSWWWSLAQHRGQVDEWGGLAQFGLRRPRDHHQSWCSCGQPIHWQSIWSVGKNIFKSRKHYIFFFLFFLQDVRVGSSKNAWLRPTHEGGVRDGCIASDPCTSHQCPPNSIKICVTSESNVICLLKAQPFQSSKI